MPFAPNGPSGAGNLDDQRLDLGDALRVRDRVVEERARQQVAVLVVVELLEERPAHALRRPTSHLTFDERGVQRPADVLRDHVPE